MTPTDTADPLLTMPGHVLRRLHQLSVATFQERMKSAGYDFTPVQFAALQTLAAHPGIDQAGLAARIAYDRATIGGVVDRLEQKGLVDRCVSARDRRAREVRLTDRGTALFEAIRPLVDSLQDDILRGLSAAERDRLIALGAKVIAAADMAEDACGPERT